MPASRDMPTRILGAQIDVVEWTTGQQLYLACPHNLPRGSAIGPTVIAAHGVDRATLRIPIDAAACGARGGAAQFVGPFASSLSSAVRRRARPATTLMIMLPLYCGVGALSMPDVLNAL